MYQGILRARPGSGARMWFIRSGLRIVHAPPDFAYQGIQLGDDRELFRQNRDRTGARAAVVFGIIAVAPSGNRGRGA